MKKPLPFFCLFLPFSLRLDGLLTIMEVDTWDWPWFLSVRRIAMKLTWRTYWKLCVMDMIRGLACSALATASIHAMLGQDVSTNQASHLIEIFRWRSKVGQRKHVLVAPSSWNVSKFSMQKINTLPKFLGPCGCEFIFDSIFVERGGSKIVSKLSRDDRQF